MFFARAISNGAKWFTPDIFAGSVHTPDELGERVDGENGEIIEAEPLPPARLTKQPVAPTNEGFTPAMAVVEAIDPEAEHVRLDHAIKLIWVDDLGKTPTQLTDSIKKRFKVDGGLNSLSLTSKEEILVALVKLREEKERKEREEEERDPQAETVKTHLQVVG